MNPGDHDPDEWSRRVLGWADRHGVAYTIFTEYVRFEVTKARVVIVFNNVGWPMPNPVNTIRRLRRGVRPVWGDGIPLHDATDLFCHEAGRLGGRVGYVDMGPTWCVEVRCRGRIHWFNLDADTGHAIATIRSAIAPR